MKNLLLLLALSLLLSSCYDNFRLGDPAGVTPSVEEPITVDNADQAVVYFSDVITDTNNNAVSQAIVSIYADGVRYSDVTSSDGQYYIEVPAGDLPQSGYISLSITKEAHVPYNSTYRAPLIGGDVYGTEDDVIAFSPCATCITLGEKSSELYHLGDDAYGGTENSQFQKRTDGTDVTIQLQEAGDFDLLKISFEVKGIQPIKFENHSSVQFYSGAAQVGEQFISEDSPIDGSFGSYTMSMDNSQPITHFKFVTRNHGEVGSDYDDWEFTCLYAEGL